MIFHSGTQNQPSFKTSRYSLLGGVHFIHPANGSPVSAGGCADIAAAARRTTDSASPITMPHIAYVMSSFSISSRFTPTDRLRGRKMALLCPGSSESHMLCRSVPMRHPFAGRVVPGNEGVTRGTCCLRRAHTIPRRARKEQRDVADNATGDGTPVTPESQGRPAVCVYSAGPRITSTAAWPAISATR